MISKILTSRLKPLLDRFISPIQSAFVAGRAISENFIITDEIIHLMGKKKGRGGLMLLKMDMEKAYDRLEWNFLKQTLLAGVCPKMD